MTYADFPHSGIANLLGIGESSELLRDAARRWSIWAEQYPVLAGATDAESFFDLRVGSQLDAPDTQDGLPRPFQLIDRYGASASLRDGGHGRT